MPGNYKIRYCFRGSVHFRRLPPRLLPDLDDPILNNKQDSVRPASPSFLHRMAMSAAAAAAAGPPRLRLVHFNDVYELSNLSRLQTFLSQVQPDATLLSGDFLSPSTLSSVDGGKGMIATLRAIGLTHCCLGNHEADLRLPDLHKRLKKLSKSAVVLNSNIGRNVLSGGSSSSKSSSSVEKKRTKKDDSGDWMVNAEWMPEYSVISTPCQRVQVALAGLLSDEPGVFPNGSFRGVPIGSVTETYSKLYEQLIATGTVHMILPLTHQFVERDKELARHMLRVASSSSSSSGGGTGGLILGGHEHTPYDVTVVDEDDPVVVVGADFEEWHGSGRGGFGGPDL